MHNHTETALYNLSFGPRGAIVDDDISRFTYALDRLSMLPHHPLFCVAVGNDGDLPYPFNRIQAPSDLVNGLGIGAYTFDKNGLKCNANKTWTLSTLSELNPNDVDSYTCDCVEDYFYPHDKHYNYFKNTIHGRKQKAAFVVTDSEKELYDLGYSRSDLPISKPPKQFLSEDELR